MHLWFHCSYESRTETQNKWVSLSRDYDQSINQASASERSTGGTISLYSSFNWLVTAFNSLHGSPLHQTNHVWPKVITSRPKSLQLNNAGNTPAPFHYLLPACREGVYTGTWILGGRMHWEPCRSWSSLQEWDNWEGQWELYICNQNRRLSYREERTPWEFNFLKRFPIEL